MPTQLTPTPLHPSHTLWTSSAATAFVCNLSTQCTCGSASPLVHMWAYALCYCSWAQSSRHHCCQQLMPSKWEACRLGCTNFEAEHRLVNLQGHPTGSEEGKRPTPVHQYSSASKCCASQTAETPVQVRTVPAVAQPGSQALWHPMSVLSLL